VYADTLIESGVTPETISSTIGVDGLPIVAYTAVGELRVAHCLDQACTTFEVNSPLGSGDYRGNVSITIGWDGLPIMVHESGAVSVGLAVTHCADVACRTGTEAYLGTWAGVDMSIVTGSDGFPVISSIGGDRSELRIIHCRDPLCEAPVDETVVDDDYLGSYADLVIAADGFPMIAYEGSGLGDPDYWLQIADCEDLTCTSWTQRPTSQEGGVHVSAAIGSDGYPIFSHREGAYLKLAHCTAHDCATGMDGWARLYPSTLTGETALAIGGDGVPIVAFHDGVDQLLHVARCSDVPCSSGHDRAHHPGSVDLLAEAVSITVGTDGFPVISYSNARDMSLNVIHCSNHLCTPYGRPK
jgi:hypothetical protein